MLAVSCGGNEAGSQTSSPNKNPDPGAAAKATPAEADPLTGTWQTSRITPADVTALLKDIGLGDAAKVVIDEQGYPTSWTLVMSDGGYVTTGDDGEVVDKGSYEIDGDRRTFNAGSGDNVYRWVIKGDELSFRFVKTEELPYKGLPAEAFNRPIYESKTFKAK